MGIMGGGKNGIGAGKLSPYFQKLKESLESSQIACILLYVQHVGHLFSIASTDQKILLLGVCEPSCSI